MISTRATIVKGLGLGLLVAGISTGCGSSNSPLAATGGTLAATGGTLAATGGTLAATGGTPAATGGTLTATGGTLAATGGTLAATGGASGVDCNPPEAHTCTGAAPTAALISDFSAPDGGGATVFGGWGQPIYGGVYVYPSPLPANPDACSGTAPQYPLTSSTASGNWHITGQVGTYSGGGLWWGCNSGTVASPVNIGCPIDASAYTGISFTISGDAGTGGISVSVGEPDTTKPGTDSAGNPKNCGTCTATSCGTSVMVPVTTTPTPVSLTWAQLGVTTPAAITSIAFSLHDPFSYATTPPVATPYSVDFVIDDLKFTP